MSNAGPGERTYSIGNGSVKLARGVRLVRAIPSEVRFHFEPKREAAVPVAVRLTGQNGREVSFEVIPNEVRISGPASRIDRIRSVLTDEIDVGKLFGTAEYHVNLFVEDPFVQIDGQPEATVRITMKNSQEK
jgi:YbbR domain-containing protein